MEFSKMGGWGGQRWRKINKNNIGLKHLKSPKKHFFCETLPYGRFQFFFIIFKEFSMDGRGGGGYLQSVKLINFTNKIRPLQTVLNGLKHEKNQQKCSPIMTPPRLTKFTFTFKMSLIMRYLIAPSCDSYCFYRNTFRALYSQHCIHKLDS